MPTASNSIAIRDHIPFDMWYHLHYILQNSQVGQARCRAIIALATSIVYTSIEVIQMVYAKIICNKSLYTQHARQGSLQWDSASLCATALISPDAAKTRALKENFFNYWVNPPDLW